MTTLDTLAIAIVVAFAGALIHIALRLTKLINRFEEDNERLIKTNKKLEKLLEGETDNVRGYYKEGDIEKFFGCAPGLTEGLSAREYIDRVRDNL